MLIVVVLLLLINTYVLIKILTVLKELHMIKVQMTELEQMMDRFEATVENTSSLVSDFHSDWKIEVNPFAKSNLKNIGYYDSDGSWDDKDYQMAIETRAHYKKLN